MKLENVPFAGLFVVYLQTPEETRRLFNGFSQDDIPEEYKRADVVRMYPFDDSIIVEIK